MHHITFVVDDLDAEGYRSLTARVEDKRKPARAFIQKIRATVGEEGAYLACEGWLPFHPDAMATHRALYNLGRTPLMLLGLAVVHYREERLPHGRDEVFRALTRAVLELRFRSDDERKLQARRLQAIRQLGG